MSVARGRCLGALLAVVAVLAGASAAAGAGTQTISPSFVAKTDQLCAAINAKFSRVLGQFPYPKFDPTKPDLKTLPLVGRHFAKAESLRRAIPGELRGLGEPAAGRRTWDTIRSLAVTENRVAIDQFRAALASDAKAFVATVNRTTTLSDAVHKHATAAGFPASSACGMVF